MPFSYTDSHACERRDTAKLWLTAVPAAGAVVGGRLGRLYGDSVVRWACERRDATSLCGLPSWPFVPVYIVIGALIGAAAAGFALVAILGRRSREPQA